MTFAFERKPFLSFSQELGVPVRNQGTPCGKERGYFRLVLADLHSPLRSHI
jgi:hypothetical protein